MPVPTIFLMADKGEIVEMNDQPYDSERLLQELLAKCPSVLAGDQKDGAARKWLFITREAGIPDADGATDRFSLDHLFLDRNGIPTLVEVKRSSDTRIRREVVGQMLDYAANAVMYWPLDMIRQRFEETCKERELEPDFVVSEFIGFTGSDSGSAVARFWEAVETNLRAGKIRLIFAADEIPAELRRIVEFLNEQMNPAEVLAIEIRQYVGTGVRTLVPNVIRSTKRIISAGGHTAAQWNRQSFIAALEERRGSDHVEIAKSIWAWSSKHCPTVWWGEGRKDGSCYIGFSEKGTNYYPFALLTSGRIQLQFQMLQQRAVPPQLVNELVSALREIPGLQMPEDAANRYPGFDMSLLKTPEILSQFLKPIEVLIERVKSHWYDSENAQPKTTVPTDDPVSTA